MTEQKQVKKPSARRRARECTVQALYSWAVSGNTAEQVELAFVLDQDMDGVDKPYFRKLFRQTVENIETVQFRLILIELLTNLILLKLQFYVWPFMNYALN